MESPRTVLPADDDDRSSAPARAGVSFDFRVIRTQELAELPVRTAPENDTARGKDAHFTIGPGRYYKQLP